MAAVGSTKVTNYHSHNQNEGQTTKGDRTYRDMLVLHVPDTLQHTSPNSVAQVLCCGLGVDVSEVDCPVQCLISIQTPKVIHSIHSSELGGEGQIGGHGRPEVALVLHRGEGSLSDK